VGALRIIELVPIGPVIERQVAGAFERTHFALVSHVDGRHKTQADNGEQAKSARALALGLALLICLNGG
jgi:hypothetical protein